MNSAHLNIYTAVHPDPDASLVWRERIGYGVGTLGFALVIPVLFSFVPIYLTNVVFLDIAAVTAIIAVSGFIDGIFALVAGVLIDRTHHPMGRARIWFLRAAPAVSVSLLLLFSVPAAFPQGIKYVYVFVVYNLLNSVFLTLGTVSQYSLVTLITRNRKEQALLGNIQAFFLNLGMVIFSLTFVRLLEHFSGGPGNPPNQQGYFSAIMIFAAVCTLLSLSVLLFVRERADSVKEDLPGPDLPSRAQTTDAVRAMLRNRNWVILLIATVCHFMSGQMNITAVPYYATYVMGNINAFSWISLASTLPGLIFMMMNPMIMRIVSKKAIAVTSFLIAAAACFIMFLSGGNMGGIVIGSLLKGVGVSLFMAVMLGMTADTIRYTSYREGSYAAGIGNAGTAFANKLGVGLGTAAFGLIMALAGFNAVNDAAGVGQSGEVLTAIKVVFGLLPALINLIGAAAMCAYHQEKDLKRYE